MTKKIDWKSQMVARFEECIPELTVGNGEPALVKRYSGSTTWYSLPGGELLFRVCAAGKSRRHLTYLYGQKLERSGAKTWCLAGSTDWDFDPDIPAARLAGLVAHFQCRPEPPATRAILVAYGGAESGTEAVTGILKAMWPNGERTELNQMRPLSRAAEWIGWTGNPARLWWLHQGLSGAAPHFMEKSWTDDYRIYQEYELIAASGVFSVGGMRMAGAVAHTLGARLVVCRAEEDKQALKAAPRAGRVPSAKTWETGGAAFRLYIEAAKAGERAAPRPGADPADVWRIGRADPAEVAAVLRRKFFRGAYRRNIVSGCASAKELRESLEGFWKKADGWFAKRRKNGDE